MKKCLPLLLIITSLLTTGCWDQIMLKDINLALALGFDLNAKKELVATVTIPYIQKMGQAGSSPITKVQILTTLAPTP